MEIPKDWHHVDERFKLFETSRPVTRAREITIGQEYGWEPMAGFVHPPCGGTPLRHPDENLVWICPACKVITDTPSAAFKAVAVEEST